jgi:hypothetical protein
MMDFIHTADLRSLLAAVANSPILVAPVTPPADFADWCGRQNADLDTVVLDWLRVESRQRKSVRLS